MRRAAATLILLSSLTFFLGLGVQAITDSDEAYYAETAREMVDGRDWLTPHFNDEERWEKPILYYWFTAAAFAAQHDPNEFDARALSALCGVGLVLLTWSAARLLTTHDDAAWIAGAIVATCYGCFAMARAALPDVPLAFFTTAAIWTSLRAVDRAERSPARWAALAGLSAGLGFLTKGPLALVIPAIVLGPIWWRERREGAGLTRPALHLKHVALACALFAIAGLPWYAAMYATHGVAYLRSFFLADNLERFATTQYNEMRAVWYYVPILVGGMMPWTVFLLVLPWRAVRDVVRGRRALTDREWRLLLWTIAPLLLFTASVGKQPRYILPLLPPIAIMLATALAERIAAPDAVARRELRIATFITALMFATVAALLYRARVLFLAALPSITWTGVVMVAAAAVALAAVAATGAWKRLPIVMAASAAVLLLTLQFGALAGRRPEAVEDIAALIRVNRFGGEPIAVYGIFVRNLIFYTRIPDIVIRDDATAAAFLHASRRVFLVASRPDFDRLKMLTTDVPIRSLGEVTFLNGAGVRLRTLLTPNPSEELDTVVLISNR